MGSCTQGEPDTCCLVQAQFSGSSVKETQDQANVPVHSVPRFPSDASTLIPTISGELLSPVAIHENPRLQQDQRDGSDDEVSSCSSTACLLPSLFTPAYDPSNHPGGVMSTVVLEPAAPCRTFSKHGEFPPSICRPDGEEMYFSNKPTPGHCVDCCSRFSATIPKENVVHDTASKPCFSLVSQTQKSPAASERHCSYHLQRCQRNSPPLKDKSYRKLSQIACSAVNPAALASALSCSAPTQQWPDEYRSTCLIPPPNKTVADVSSVDSSECLNLPKHFPKSEYGLCIDCLNQLRYSSVGGTFSSTSTLETVLCPDTNDYRDGEDRSRTYYSRCALSDSSLPSSVFVNYGHRTVHHSQNNGSHHNPEQHCFLDTKSLEHPSRKKSSPSSLHGGADHNNSSAFAFSTVNNFSTPNTRRKQFSCQTAAAGGTSSFILQAFNNSSTKLQSQLSKQHKYTVTCSNTSTPLDSMNTDRTHCSQAKRPTPNLIKTTTTNVPTVVGVGGYPRGGSRSSPTGAK